MKIAAITAADEMWSLVSDRENLYEKYGVSVVEVKQHPGERKNKFIVTDMMCY